MKKFSLILCFTLIHFSISAQQEAKDTNFDSDIIIYGGTAAAVTAAVQIAKMGKSVLVVSPDTHLGGLSSSGLGYTDTGNKSVIGGLSRDFYQRIYDYYEQPEIWKWENKEEFGIKGQGNPRIDGKNRTLWIFEPHVAEKIFEDYIEENNITVHKNEFLDRENGIKMNEGKIISITTLSGKTYAGNVFIDATYEGDLMATAGVSYHVGREANTVYDEEWNGIQLGVLHHKHHFGAMNISPYIEADNPESGVLPRISIENPGKNGESDSKIQAYCFRMCLTNVEENKVPFEKPANYDPTQYELVARVYESGWNETFEKFDAIPNHKTDTNNHGPFSTDNIGMNYDYPEASYERRKEIVKEHVNYQMGLLYFIATDPRIPKEVQEEFNQWGLAKDEFKDNGHWPHQIYVREARRMIGQYVMTENEIMGRKTITEPIGMGSYTMDSHNVQRYITPDGFVQNEGDVGISSKEPYKIALGAILPKKTECSNLIVPVAVSSSHIAFGSIRMEPVFMILGQSAGIIAAIAFGEKVSVQDIAYDKIRKQLVKDQQVLEIPKKE